MSEHPSSFQLDLMSLQRATGSTAEHVGSCKQCQAYVEAYRPELVVPGWVTKPRPPRRWYALSSVVAALAISFALIFVVVTSGAPPAEQTRVKSLPSFALYVEHGASVQVWDGHSTVEAGDRLQLKVAPMGFRYLAVASSGEAGWSHLYEAAVPPAGEFTLPQSFQVDDRDDSIGLGVLLCDAPCGLDDLVAAQRTSRRDAHRWFSQFTLIRKTP